MLDKDNPDFTKLVKQAIRDVFKCEDSAFADDIYTVTAKIFYQTFRKRFENCKSKYRADLAKHRECRFVFGASC